MRRAPRQRSLVRGKFLIFLAARTVDLTGSAMTPVVLPLAILGATGSVTDAGLVAASSMIPTIAFMVLGGAVADRFPRRTLLCVTGVAAAVMQACIGALLVTDHYELWTVMTLSVGSGVVSAFSGPALRGIVPELVPTTELQRANALLASAGSAVRLGGPLLAGLLVATVGGGWALLADALTSLSAAVGYLLLPTAGHPAVTPRLLGALAAGWRAFSSTPWIWVSSISFAVINAANVAPLQIVGAAIVAPALGAVAWGALLSGRILGMLVAGAALLKWQLKSPLITGRLFGLLGALPFLGFALTQNFPLLLALSVLSGVGFSVLAVTYDTTLHSSVPLARLSSVSAWDDLFAFAAIPVAQLLIGPIATQLGNQTLTIWCGILLLAATAVPLAIPSLRAMSRRVGASTRG
ncbi:MFS transporter [Cryocola sp. 340MFSha3.1]|uniref:MFS transporter n=1 Tax=Cryocola sp. 340MFSha3.1 TaxID=1169145 RepID=UPI0009DBCEAE